jgi:hypothetical protein
MINFKNSGVDAASKGVFLPSEFELQTSICALMVIEERDAWELHCRSSKNDALLFPGNPVSAPCTKLVETGGDQKSGPDIGLRCRETNPQFIDDITAIAIE